MNLYENILHILRSYSFKEILHSQSHSCDESKRFREDQGLKGVGSKNIVFHCKGNFYLVVTLGDKEIKARNFKHEFGSKDIRFASQEEITNTVGAKIGSIPPFGFNNKNIPIFVDYEIFENEYFIFNPGDPTKSIQVLTKDLKEIFSKQGNPLKYFVHKNEEFKILD